MRNCSALAGLCLSLWFVTGANAQADLSEEDEHYVIFNETIQVAADGHAQDLCFEDTGFNIIRTNQMIWVADPQVAGVRAIASRPIRDVAKAGESMGTRADRFAAQIVALYVNQDNTYLIDQRGMLFVIHKGWVDSLQVGSGVTAEVDVAAASNGLSYVLWGGEVRVYADPPGPEPLWIVPVSEDVRPVVSIAVGTRGEILLAGQGRTALVVYDIDAEGQWSEVRNASRQDLDVGTVQGMCLSPGMLLPEPGREGWVETDRFVLLADSELGELIALEKTTLEVVGKQSVRSHVPFASPGRLSISNRGQIAFIDQRANAAHVLSTSLTLEMVRSADFRWRLLDRPGAHRVRKEEPAEPDTSSAGKGG